MNIRHISINQESIVKSEIPRDIFTDQLDIKF